LCTLDIRSEVSGVRRLPRYAYVHARS
jgi:hypothetical protein